LKKGEAGSYDNVNGLSVPKKADIRYALAWRNDKLSFSHTSLKEVMDEIERFYNVKVIFQEESLKEKTITGYFNTDSMTNLLSIISITLDISISYSNGVVTVNERPQRNKTIKG
jgi:ferric-dicitrate binding protein FerR (iron transport regulator)